VDLHISEELEHFRAEVRVFIAEHAPHVRIRRGVRAPKPQDIPALRVWNAKLYDAGYIGREWPAEWGGQPDADPFETLVIAEEMARAEAPSPIGASDLAAGALIGFGSPAQKATYLPRIRAGHDIWCQLFSEPSAGSDLASLQTSARRLGDTYVVDGQKVWTTNAHHADLGYLLARTDPDAPKHAGITAFILDMNTRGVDVRPLREITGTTDFNEVFLDGVQIPAANVIGVENQGWDAATYSLAHERQGSAGFSIALKVRFPELLELAQTSQRGRDTAIDRDDIRQDLARLYAEVCVCNYLVSYGASQIRAAALDSALAAISKVFFSELNLRIAEFALALQASASILTEDDQRALDAGRWQDAFLYARAYTISGGSNEIMRNLISERSLGLPREPTFR
jgi:alkylation response protein AidB-like acyl-CoA dehydrogenase